MMGMRPPYPVDLIIFDLDGTLVDSLKDLATSVNFALRTLGLSELPIEAIAASLGEGSDLLMRQTLGPERLALVGRALELFRSHYAKHLLDSTCLYPGVRETLERFRGKKKAIVSNKSYNFTLEIVKGLGIVEHFDLILGVDSILHRKPHPEPVEKVLHKLGGRREAAIMVGDSPLDVEMGRRAGILTCAVTYGWRPREELLKAGPDVILDDIRELMNLLR